MEKMLTEICEYLNNYFWRQKIEGSFKIVDGTITVSTLKEGQYFRIIGSIFNDGVYKYPVSDLTDEEFKGAVWSMAVPQAVIDLASDIQKWQDKYGAADSESMSPFSSESFGNYSYSKRASSTSNDVNPNTWQVMFGNRLNKYRRLRGIP